jgi:UDP-GlcNAc:undecaprenyl-phosphate GlcNAc-1-phosphate transferase
MPFRWLDLIPVACSFGLGLILTPLVRALARKRGVVARPRSDRWHQKPTALLGGIAIFGASFPTLEVIGLRIPHGRAILGACMLLFATGLVDDLRRLRPYQKLLGQVVGAAWVVWDGLTLSWTGWPALDVPITLFWLVGITNALNLLDNMDGLATGIAILAACVRGILFWLHGQPDEALLLAGFAAVLAGFLVYNTNPASIFMGDSGSLFIGFFLASTALLHASDRPGEASLAETVVPILILAVPIFDTTFVTIARKRAGRAISEGGRDHTSHRLVAIGLSERWAVRVLYGLAALGGSLALLVDRLELVSGLVLAGGFAAGLMVLGVRLARVDVYAHKTPDPQKSASEN